MESLEAADLHCSDCLGRKRRSVYFYFSPCFAGDAQSRITCDALLVNSFCAEEIGTLKPEWID
jgi:hypothetical protein